MSNISDCKGCYSYSICPNVHTSADKTKCPCRTCIVKMLICTGCDEYRAFFESEFFENGCRHTLKY